MLTCHYYWVFEPIRGRILDTPDKIPVTLIQVPFLGTQYELSVFCDSKMVPDFARLIIPDLSTEEIPEKFRPLLLMSKEHLLSCLKLTYAHDIEMFPNSIWAFVDATKPYHLGFDLTKNFEEKPLDADTLKNFFSASFSFRDEVRLILDGSDAKIPLQYRYLSLYKLLEIEFKQSGAWDYTALNSALDTYRNDFKELGFETKPSNLLHEIRDKCAHIKTGRQQEMLGVTHLNFIEAERVEKLLPILRDVCRDILNQKAAGFGFGTHRDTEKFGTPG